MANRLIIVFGLFLVALVVSNPGEIKYLKSIGTEYGQMHNGLDFPPARLLRIGIGERNNYVFASTYQYEFGNVSVEYFGFAGMIFKTSVNVNMKEPDKKEGPYIIA